MYEYDIKLDVEGNSVINNGEFELTNSDIEFVLRMLITHRGSWKLHEDLGVGLEKYVGEIMSPELLNRIRTDIDSFFKKYGIIPEISIVPTGHDSCMIDMSFISLTNRNKERVRFSLVFEDGSITFHLDADKTVQPVTGISEIVKTKNKYLKRAGLSVLF